jgi:hypothetical protein
MVMLKIRKEHMDAQSAAARDTLDDRMVELLREEFPEARDEPLPEMRRVVREQADKALGYGLSAEQHVAVYVTTAWLLGTDFDVKFPAARDTLTSRVLGSGEKADRLAKMTEHLFVALEEEG